MANSGIEWIDTIFNFCVRLLYDVANILDMKFMKKLTFGFLL